MRFVVNEMVFIGNAKVAGIEKALKMEGYDYNVAISIYFGRYFFSSHLV